MIGSVVYVLVFLFAVFLSSSSQVMLKSSAKKTYKNSLREYLNFLVVPAYILLFCSTILSTIAYRAISLVFGTILETTGYIWVSILSKFFLAEKIGKEKVLGLIIIVIGIIIFNLG